MTTFQPTPYPMPPPTSNALNSRQRSKLVRSTRKLGEVLGTTPIMTENVVPQPISVSFYSPSSSASSSRSTTPDSHKASRRNASICSYTPGSPNFIYTSPAGTSSVVSLTLPPSGATSLVKKASMRFKSPTKSRPSNELPRPLVLRLNAVPPPIIVRPPRSPVPSTTSELLTPTPGTPTPTSTPVITPTTPVFPSSAEIRRKRVAKLSRTLGETIPPYLVSASKRPAALAEFESDPPLMVSPVSEASRPMAGTRQRRSMSVDYSGQTAPLAKRSSKIWTTGSESWKGEWNRKDIKDVQKQLRSLRAR